MAGRFSAPVTTRGVRANAGITKAYERKIMSSVKAMHDELAKGVKEILKRWDVSSPISFVGDAKAVDGVMEDLKRFFSDFSRKWGARLDQMSVVMADWFGSRAKATAKAQFVSALREIGFAVRISPSEAVARALDKLITSNVNLIKTIHADHLAKVKALVEESVYKGRDLAGLERELTSRFGVTARRARMIAKDQNNKASQDLARVQASEAGITRGVWEHMRASVKPRPTHELMDGREFDLEEGLYDPDEGRNVKPGELINCNCEFRLVIPGMERSPWPRSGFPRRP